MRIGRVIALAIVSVLAVISLSLAGAIWFVMILNVSAPLIADAMSRALTLPVNPVPTFATFDMLTLVLAMTPWAALCAWVYWSLEGAWPDLLDPRGCAPQPISKGRSVGALRPSSTNR